MNYASLIEGKVHRDNRGALISYNEFSLDPIRRTYVIENLDTEIVRAWQAHKAEQKWFYVTAGSFILVTVKVDDFDSPSKKLTYNEWVISAEENKILHVPGGFANGFRSIAEHSKLLVFSSSTLEESKEDDYRFDPSLWYNWNDGTSLNKDFK